MRALPQPLALSIFALLALCVGQDAPGVDPKVAPYCDSLIIEKFICDDSALQRMRDRQPESACDSGAAPLSCGPGVFGSGAQRFADVACPGYYSPAGQQCLIKCSIGAYCPRALFDQSTSLCMPYGQHGVPLALLAHPERATASAEKLGCANASSDNLCAAGSYCPDTTQQFLCPTNHFCRSGSFQPSPCPLLSNCGEGESPPGASLGTLLASTGVFNCLFVLQRIYLRIRNNRRERRAVENKLVYYDYSTQDAEGSSSFHPQGDAAEHRVSETSERVKKHRLARVSALAAPSQTNSHANPKSMPANADYIELEEYEKTESQRESYVSKTNLESLGEDTRAISLEFEDLGLKIRGSEKWCDIFLVVDKAGGSFAEQPREKLPPACQRLLQELRERCPATSIHDQTPPECIFRGLSGRIRSGKMTAIMGVSGAGKTSFLNVLCGKAHYGETVGTIRVNGARVSIGDLRTVIGFVPQDDVMHANLTAKENVRFSAAYRLPTSKTPTERRVIVNYVLKALGIHHIRHDIVGDSSKRGISGGQKKRVNIAMELVADPSLLFLDEPTSGLDSSTSLEILQALQTVAQRGVTVVAVIHQPRFEILEMFDEILLLGAGGTVVYNGSPVQGIAYFESIGFPLPQRVNPADFFIDVASGSVQNSTDPHISSKDLPRLWSEHRSILQRDSSSPELTNDERRAAAATPLETADTGSVAAQFHRKRNSFACQTMISAYRGAVQLLREDAFVVNGGLFLLAGTVVGLLYFGLELEEMPQAFFMTVLSAGLSTIQASLTNFGAEKDEFRREAASGLNPLAYYLGKNLSHMIWVLFSPYIFASVFYSLALPRMSIQELYVNLFAIAFACSGIGYAASVLVSSSSAQLAGVVVGLLSALFGGFAISLDNLYEMTSLNKPITSLSFVRWGLELMFLTERGHYEPAYENSLAAVSNLYGWHNTTAADCKVALILLGLFARIVGLCIVLYQHKKCRTSM